MTIINRVTQPRRITLASVAHNVATCAALVATAFAGGCDGDTPALDATPMPCTDTHDEDGDGIGDRCDICPTVADPQQLDLGEEQVQQFADRVGDACDPRPARGGDKRVALHTFAGDDATLRNTGWTIDADRAIAAGDARFDSARSYLGDGLIVQVQVVAFGGTVQLSLDGGETAGSGCRLARDRDGDGHDELDVFEIGATTTTHSLGRALEGDIRLTAIRAIAPQRTAEIFCRVKQADSQEIEHDQPLTDDSSTGGYTATVTGGAEASSMIVYTTPVPKDP